MLASKITGTQFLENSSFFEERRNARAHAQEQRKKVAESPATRAAVNSWAQRMLNASKEFEHSGAYTGERV